MAQEKEIIRARLRLVTRFFIAIKNTNGNITDMKSVFDPRYYDAVIEAVNIVGRYNNKTQLYDTPSNPSNIGFYIKKMGARLISMCIIA